jgi:hypothetical protein
MGSLNLSAAMSSRVVMGGSSSYASGSNVLDDVFDTKEKTI